MNFDLGNHINKHWFWYLLPLWILLVLVAPVLIIGFVIKVMYDIVLYGCELFFRNRFNSIMNEKIDKAVKENQKCNASIVKFACTFSALEVELYDIQRKYGRINFLFDSSESFETLINPIMKNLDILRNIAIKSKILVALKGQNKVTFDKSKITHHQCSEDLLQECYGLLNSIYSDVQRFSQRISQKVFFQRDIVLFLNDRVMTLVEKCQDNVTSMIQERNNEISKKNAEIAVVPNLDNIFSRSYVLEGVYADTFDKLNKRCV